MNTSCAVLRMQSYISLACEFSVLFKLRKSHIVPRLQLQAIFFGVKSSYALRIHACLFVCCSIVFVLIAVESVQSTYHICKQGRSQVSHVIPPDPDYYYYRIYKTYLKRNIVIVLGKLEVKELVDDQRTKKKKSWIPDGLLVCGKNYWCL